MMTVPFGNPVSPEIAAEDEMYTHAAAMCNSPTLGRMSYFRAGMQMEDAVRQLIEWHFKDSSKILQVLDFASGYGRSTRFFAARYGPESVTASDLRPEALAFQHVQLGVAPLLSVTKPESFRPGRQWDCIFVNSLFNKLSQTETTRWMWKLHSLLAPNGLLVFTSGYGDKSVSLGFLHNAIIAATGSLSHVRVPQGLCFTHDLFAVAKGPLRQDPIQFQYGPDGCVDFCRWTEPQQMKATGWAYDMTPGESIARVNIFYNGVLSGSCEINHDRPDIAATLGRAEDPSAIHCGWDCTLDLRDLPICPTEDWLLAKAVSTSGREWVLRLDHPANIAEFEMMHGWTYDPQEGKSQAIYFRRFIDQPINGHFATDDANFSGWLATPVPDDLERMFLVGRFGEIPYTLVDRPDVFAEQQIPAIGFQAVLPPEYLTVHNPALRFVNREGVVLTAFETVVDFVART